jgi:vacuolar-type H+-ATPase subunit E/Vma4
MGVVHTKFSCVPDMSWMTSFFYTREKETTTPPNSLTEPLLEHAIDEATHKIHIVDTSTDVETLIESIKYRFENFVRMECSIYKTKDEKYYIVCGEARYPIVVSVEIVNDVTIFAGSVLV